MSSRTTRWALMLLACAVLAGLGSGLMDSIQFHYHESLPGRQGWNAEYWNPEHSWRYKYARTELNTLQPAPDNWYYRTFDIAYQERYPLSATALAWTTDAWHLAKTISWGTLRLALVFVLVEFFRMAYEVRGKSWWKWLLAYVVLWLILTIVQAIGFHLIYSWL
jgi:hypothetical protein